MAKLSHNVLANFFGQAWTALIGVLFLPVYIRLLGMEAYGLIGVYISMQALLFVFDIGLSATLNRELARTAQAGVGAERARDLVRTLESVFWPLCLLIALLVASASTMIASRWLQPVTFSENRVAHAIVLMGLATATQWPSIFYSGGLNGLERQITVNLINVIFATLRWVAVIPVLMWVRPTIEVYLGWQIAVALLQAAAMRALLIRALPRRPGQFRLALLSQVRDFAVGMFFIAALSFLLMQTDRLVLSRLLPLDHFGRYVLVATAAATLSRVVSPFFNAIYPRFSALVASHDRSALIRMYHTSNQVLAVIVASVASVLIIFAEDALRLWTHNPDLAAEGAPILRTLALGAALNGLMSLPYALQLAHGWTRLALYQNVMAVIVVVPSTWFLAGRFGAQGAASVWAALNLMYFTIGIPVMHRKLLRDEMKAWYFRDILPAIVAAAATATAARLAFHYIPDNRVGLLILALISISTIAVCATSVTATRRLFREGSARLLNALRLIAHE